MSTHTLILAAALFFAVSAPAASVSIINPGFEADLAAVQGGGGWTDAVPTGWSDPAGGDNSNFLEVIAGFASEGQVHLGFDANDELGTIYQDLGTAWAPNTTYTLTVGVGNRTAFGGGVARIGFGSSTDAPPPAASLWTPSVYSEDIPTMLVAPVSQSFADATIQFSTGAVAPAGNIRLAVHQIDGATRIHVDNFRLDATAIPEPASTAVIGLAVGLLLRRRRK